MAEYKLSVQAVGDLDQILEYTVGQFGELQAEKYVSKLDEHLAMLAQNPFIAPEREEFAPPVRIFPSGSHFIVYLAKDDHILVVRFIHQKMDLKRHL